MEQEPSVDSGAPVLVEMHESVIYQDIGDEAVILDMATQQYYGLNPMGARIWKLLLELGNTETVCRRIATEFEVEPGVAHADIVQLVRELVDTGLLSRLDEPVHPALIYD